jgi:hypothetical protein
MLLPLLLLRAALRMEPKDCNGPFSDIRSAELATPKRPVADRAENLASVYSCHLPHIDRSHELEQRKTESRGLRLDRSTGMHRFHCQWLY